MTTSVSATAHGKIALAWRAHPFGIALLAAAVVLAIVGLVELMTNRPLLGRLRPGLWWVWLGLGGLLVGWGLKAAAGYLRGDYPLP